jgi:cell division protein FtsZ
MYEIDEAAKTITEAADPDANIIFGAIIDEAMSGEVKITVIATGFEQEKMERNKPKGMEQTTFSSQSLLNRAREREEPKPALPVFEEEKEEEEDDQLEVPAFIRRKLK